MNSDMSVSLDSTICLQMVQKKASEPFQLLFVITLCPALKYQTAESHAIKLALGIAGQTRKNQYVIVSDFMSELQAVSHFDLDNQLMLEIITECTRLIKMGKQIVFCWIPSHVGIPEIKKNTQRQNMDLTNW